MSALKYQQVFTADINQITDITLAGQSDDAPVTPDHKVTLSVLKAELDALLTWTGEYSSTNVADSLGDGGAEVVFPSVTFNPAAIFGNASVMAVAERLNSVSYDLLTSPNHDVPTLQGQFKGISAATFTSDLAWAPANIPLEAVVKVVNNAMTGNKFTEAITASNATDQRSSKPVDLYEQAVAAGKTKTGSLNLSVGDSVSLYITYTLAKTRTYHLDTADAATQFGDAPLAKAMVGGVSVTDGDSESAIVTKTYEFEFVAA